MYVFFRNRAGEPAYRKLVDKNYIVIDRSHYQPLVTEEEKDKELPDSASGQKSLEDKVISRFSNDDGWIDRYMFQDDDQMVRPTIEIKIKSSNEENDNSQGSKGVKDNK